MKLQINAGDENVSNAQADAIVKAYGNKFIIPLDFEMWDSAIRYYQSELGNRPCYKLMFNEYGKVIYASGQTPSSDAKYEISDKSLKYEVATQTDLGSRISTEYQNMASLYDRVFRQTNSSE